jgi:hypothetical protein
MMKRCYKVDCAEYYLYGGRGIQVCDRWREKGTGVVNFVEDLGPRPEGTSLERKDVNGDYTPENCKWAGVKEQSFNKRRSPKNKSGRTGVDIVVSRKGVVKYRAAIRKDGKLKVLLTTSDFDEAVRAREEAEIEVYGHIKECEK